MTRIIKTVAQHAAAMTRLFALVEVDPAPGTAEADERELLAHLIEDYEKKHHDLGLPDPLTAITFRMEQQGLSHGGHGALLRFTASGVGGP